MKERFAGTAAGMLAAAAGAAAVWWWLALSPGFELAERTALASNITARAAARTISLDLEGVFTSFSKAASDLAGSWPRFRGPRFDNIVANSAPISTDWGPEGPPVIWSVDLGEGHAGAAVHNGRVYILDYDEEKKGDSLRCFSLADGGEIWRRSYRVSIKRNHGISRTVPAVTDRYVVAVGPKCHVTCVDAVTGEFLWGKDLVSDFGATVPLWYTGQCPLIDEGVAVLAPGGESLLIGVDCETGEVLWRTPNPDGWKMSHSSVMPMDFNGRKMYVYAAAGGVAGVAADGPDRGKVLWKTDEWNHSVIAPSPVPIGDGRVFMTAGYGAGSMMLEVSEEAGRFEAKALYSLEKTVFGCEQQTPILYEGLLFTVMPNDAGALKREFACLDPSGELVWTSGRENRFGLGPFIAADGKFLILSDDGVLTIIEASDEEYRPLASAKILDGRDAWAPMALVGGRLLMRDSKKLVCLDIEKR